MKHTLFIITALFFLQLNAQVGIGTTSPDPSSILDINSTTKGVLMPRLTSLERNAIVSPANGLIIYNTDNTQLELNKGTTISPVWVSVVSNVVSNDSNNIITAGTDGGAHLESTFHTGKFRITSSGNITITGLPFKPSKITFSAYANIESYNIDDDNDTNVNNTPGIANSFGSMTGFASNSGGVIQQQAISVSGHGNSINDISRYASSSHAIGIRYGNKNGDSLGKTTAIITSFDTYGFSLNIDSFADGLVIIYEAHR